MSRHVVLQEDATPLSLKCNISIDVNQLEEGIKLALKDDREKTSDALSRLAVFAGSSVISRLPPYLTVHMVRFFYKADVQQKAKILRKVRPCRTSTFKLHQKACNPENVNIDYQIHTSPIYCFPLEDVLHLSIARASSGSDAWMIK